MGDTLFIGGKSYMITRAEGSNADLTKYGTYASAGSDDKYMLVTNFTSSLKNNMILIYTLGGGRSYQQVVPGKFESSGSIETDVQNAAFLRYALGNLSSGTSTTIDLDGVAITGSPTTLKSYCISEADVLDSFSMDIYNQNDVVSPTVQLKTRYTGCKLNQLELKADTDNPFHATMDFIAQTPTTSSSTGVSDPTTTSYSDVPKMFYQGQLLIGSGDYGTGVGTSNTLTDSSKAWDATGSGQWATNYVVIDKTGTSFPITSNTATALTVVGTPASGLYAICPLSSYATDQVVQCNSVDTTLNNNLEQYWSINNGAGRGIKYAIEKIREYSLTLDMNFTNTDQLGRFYTGAAAGTSPATSSAYTPFMVVLDFKTASSLGNAYKSMRLVFTDVVFDEDSLPLDPKEIVKQTLTAKAKHCIVYQITSETQ